jgi:RNA polymerase sigma factor (sigma-70 family)
MNLIQIIEGCKRKEERCQKMLYVQFYGYALKIAFRYLYRYDVAVNVINDGFVKLFQHIGNFKYEETDFPERLLMSWMKKIMINKSIDELRRNKMTPEMGGIPNYVWDLADNSQGADRLLLYKDMISNVKKLPPMYRIVFNMYVIDGYNHFEVAETLGISVGTSKSNLSRAKGILRDILKEKKEVDRIT